MSQGNVELSYDEPPITRFNRVLKWARWFDLEGWSAWHRFAALPGRGTTAVCGVRWKASRVTLVCEVDAVPGPEGPCPYCEASCEP